MAADEEVQDKDIVAKQKGKDYADNRRNARESDLQQGDQVLLKQNKRNMLDTHFHPEPYKVVDRKGSEVTVQSSTGERYRRNVTHVKKFHTETTQLTTPGQPEESVEAKGSSPQPEVALRRSQRERHVPEHLKDYELC